MTTILSIKSFAQRNCYRIIRSNRDADGTVRSKIADTASYCLTERTRQHNQIALHVYVEALLTD